MFGFHQAAAQLNPGYIWGTGCHYCTRTCWDTCGFSCGWGSETTIYQALAHVNPGDPVEQLAALRKHLESTLAGLDAQEKALRERTASAKG
jgi:hypothetical protein